MKFLRHTLFMRWSASLVVAMLIFGLVRPTFAQMLGTDTILAQFVVDNDVEVGSEGGDNGFRHIYYVFNGNKTFITNSSYANADPVTDREYIAWMGQIDGSWSIFLYHIPIGTTTQISNSANNANPRLSNGKVVWEGWVEDAWQVFLFDGASVRQVTQGELSVNPDIEGDDVIYARRDAQGGWRTLRHSLGTDEAVIIREGAIAKKPIFRDGTLVFPIEEDIEREEARKKAEEAQRLAEQEAQLKQEEEDRRLQEAELLRGQENNFVQAPLEGLSFESEEDQMKLIEFEQPETVTEEEIITELESEEPAPVLQEEIIEESTTENTPVLEVDTTPIEEAPTEGEPIELIEFEQPETIAEEEIIGELEGDPLVGEEITGEEAMPAEEEPSLPEETQPQPIGEKSAPTEVLEPEPILEPAPNSTSSPQTEPAPEPEFIPAPSPEPTPEPPPAP